MSGVIQNQPGRVDSKPAISTTGSAGELAAKPKPRPVRMPGSKRLQFEGPWSRDPIPPQVAGRYPSASGGRSTGGAAAQAVTRLIPRATARRVQRLNTGSSLFSVGGIALARD